MYHRIMIGQWLPLNGGSGFSLVPAAAGCAAARMPAGAGVPGAARVATGIVRAAAVVPVVMGIGRRAGIDRGGVNARSRTSVRPIVRLLPLRRSLRTRQEF